MLASTSEVYGDPLVHPQPEDYRGNVSTTGPRSVYDEAKRYAEALTMAYHRHHRIDTRIVRIFNSFGPKMMEDDGRMVPSFIRQALLGEPLSVYGDGSQTRSVQYIDDLIEGLIRLMKSEETRPVNIGNPVEYSVREVAEMIIELSGSQSQISHQPLPEDDPKQRCPDITRAREVLGWEPQTPAREGLARTLTWFASQAQARTPLEVSHMTRGECP
jgi:dTDP-glucose 4,6-dehydratase